MSTLGDRLHEQEEAQVAASEALTEALVQAAVDKREAQLSDPAVPADKCPL